MKITKKVVATSYTLVLEEEEAKLLKFIAGKVSYSNLPASLQDRGTYEEWRRLFAQPVYTGLGGLLDDNS